MDAQVRGPLEGDPSGAMQMQPGIPPSICAMAGGRWQIRKNGESIKESGRSGRNMAVPSSVPGRLLLKDDRRLSLSGIFIGMHCAYTNTMKDGRDFAEVEDEG